MSTPTTTTAGAAGQQQPPKQQEYEFHPIANVFPLMKGDEFKRFKKDIRTNKLREQIIIYEGKILDGRNRYNACKELGLPVDTRLLPAGTDPIAFVVSANIHRRHLNESQRATVAAQLATFTEVVKLPKEKQAELTTASKVREAVKQAKQAKEEAEKKAAEGDLSKLSDEIDGLVDSLIDKLKEMKAKKPQNAEATVAELIQRLQVADLYTEPTKKAA